MKATLDIRMIRSSGIGTYIRNLIPKVIAANSDIAFSLLGELSIIRQMHWAHGKNVTLINCRSPIYSITEQLELFQKIPKDTTLFWSPHYNIPLLYTGKLLVTIHDVFHLSMSQYIKRIYSKCMFRALSHKANTVICVSQFTKDELIRLTNLNKQKIYTVYNGVDNSWFHIKKELNPYKRPYLLFVGNVKPHKNLVRLIKAYQLIMDKIPHNLVIVGKKHGLITADKEVLVYASRLGNRIDFTGFLDDATLKQYYIYADALVFPSLYEGFGLPPLEAMSCGCPVVVSNVSSLPEVCGDAAYYVDPYSIESIAEGMYKVLTDNSLRQNLIKKGLERANLFSWEKSAKEHIKVFEEILNS